MLQAYAGNDPRFKDVEWVRIDPSRVPHQGPSIENQKIFRAREIWLNR